MAVVVQDGAYGVPVSLSLGFPELSEHLGEVLHGRLLKESLSFSRILLPLNELSTPSGKPR